MQSEAPTSDVNPDSTDAPATVTILPNKKKRISKKSKLIGITALFLVICILFTGFWQPGFFIKNEKRKAPITGVSAIKPPSKVKRVKPETATVGYENNRAEFDSGVIVDFGAYNLQADEKLSVRSLGAKNDGDYEAVLYDFDIGKTDPSCKCIGIFDLLHAMLSSDQL